MAVHEAGHALMTYLKHVESFEVSISYVHPKTVSVYKQPAADDVKNLVLIYYSGAVAEELVLGKMYGGAMGRSEADFPMATEMIKTYIVMTNPNVSKSMLDIELASQLIEYSKEFYQITKDILSEHKETLDLLAQELMRKNVLTKEEIEDFMRERNI